MLVFLWTDTPPYGQWMQLLLAVDDRGVARRLADASGLEIPQKGDRIDRHHPLHALACQNHGELLWRADVHPDHLDGFEDHPWQTGAASAVRFRATDAARYIAVQDAARERRKQRR